MGIRALLAMMLAALPANPQEAADHPEVVRFVSSVAPSMLKLMVRDGQGADKILFVGKSDTELLVVGIAVTPRGGDWIAVPEPERTIAVLRTRERLEGASVDPADLAFAKMSHLPVFIQPERDRKLIREIADRNGVMMIRDIGQNGSSSAWREP